MKDKELTEIEKKDLERMRIKKRFEDGRASGSVLIDEFSLQSFLDLRKIARKYFNNRDGPAVSAMIQMFKADELKREIIDNGVDNHG